MKNTISYRTLPPFELLTPTSLDQALNLLDEHQGAVKLIAGGTDLLIELRNRLRQPKIIIDIKRIPELHKLELSEEGLKIGATTSIHQILMLPEVKTDYRTLYQSLIDIADKILRFRATIGGNLATASPAADTAAPLLVLNAQVVIESLQRGEKSVPIHQFFVDVKRSILSPDEIVKSIIIPKPVNGTQSSYQKMKRSVEDIALVGVAGLKNRKQLLLAYSAVAPTPILVDLSYSMDLSQLKLNNPVFDSIWEQVLPSLKPINDIRAGKKYRTHIADILTRRVLKEIW